MVVQVFLSVGLHHELLLSHNCEPSPRLYEGGGRAVRKKTLWISEC